MTKAWICFGIIGFIELTAPHLLRENRLLFEPTLQFMLFLLALGAFFETDSDHWLLFSVYFGWLFFSDFLIIQSGYYMPAYFSFFEAGILGLLLFWIWKRRLPKSDEIGETLCFSFCKDYDYVPARVASFAGLRVTGIGVVIGDEAMIPNAEERVIEKRNSKSLRRWHIVDTYLPVNKNILTAFYKLEGRAITRMNCLVQIRSFTKLLGEKFKSGIVPNIYMEKIYEVRG